MGFSKGTTELLKLAKPTAEQWSALVISLEAWVDFNITEEVSNIRKYSTELIGGKS
jgi:hypothetical protein